MFVRLKPCMILSTPLPSPPADSAALLMCHRIIRAQTSSLNVAAGDYDNPLSRAPVDLLHLEPSPAPRRRALPPSMTATSTPGRGGGGGKRGIDVPSLSSSLMRSSMSSSSASLLASSPPRSRAGALARAPTAREPLSSSRDVFQRAPVSLLDMPYSPDCVEAMPEAVHIPSTCDSGMPGIVPHNRSDSSNSPAMTKSEGEGEMDEMKFGENRREMMSRLQVQQSFKADAPVSLEQVRVFLGVSVRSCGLDWFRAPSSADFFVVAVFFTR